MVSLNILLILNDLPTIKQGKQIVRDVRKILQTKISNTKRTKQNRLVLISNCAIGSKKKSRFIKNQEASGLLNGLGIRTPLNNVPVIGNILF